MIKLIAIDLDGTLMDSEKKISEANIEAAQRARQQGIYVVLVSARPPFGMSPAAERLGLDGVLIAYNGAYALKLSTRQVLIDRPMARADAHAVVHIFRRHDLYAGYYAADEWYVEKVCAEMEWEAQSLKRQPEIVPDLTVKGLPAPHKMILIDLQRSGRLHDCLNEIRKSLPHVNAHFSSEYGLEISDEHATKAGALAVIVDRMGLESGQVAAIGDGENDLSMLQYAGIGVAMGNAPSQVQVEADWVVTTNDHDGVAQAIDTILKQNSSR
jgi:Cof subfamily protein (haloacid dehalogenase superfamily)